MASTGKSTISRTLAKQFSKSDQLGATFFFKRGEADRGKMAKFYATIADQMMRSHHKTAPFISDAIRKVGEISEMPLRAQYEHLIRDPLLGFSQTLSEKRNLTFVFDALDECEQDEQVKLVVDCISKPFASNLITLKFFITSRPDLAVRSNFRAEVGKCQQFVLHEIPATTIKQDIKTFLHFELEDLKYKYNASVPPHRQLPLDWPGLSILEELAKMASPLFTFASTVRRFISDRVWGSPDDRLKIVLEYNTRSQESKLDGTYLPVMNQLLNRPESIGYLPLSTSEQNKLVLDYRLLLASIIVLETPLSVTSLAGLLDKSEGCAYSKLDFLHSVLSVPEPPAPIRILHLSFRDFLLDPEKSRRNRFWIDESQPHGHLARSCMNVMGRLLKRDICSSESQGKPFSEVQRKYIR